MTIRFEKISKSFSNNKVLDQVSFEIPTGQVLYLLGRSGAGKSVILKHLVGLFKPDEGEIWVDGLEITCLSAKDLVTFRKTCGYIFQYPALLDSLNIYENIAFALRIDSNTRFGNRHEKEVSNRVHLCLTQVGLDPKILYLKPPDLSFGMQKRVSIARTIALSPNILLFDEPTTSLDPQATQGINQLIDQLARKSKATCIVVSHDMESALDYADRILVIDQAQIISQGSPSEIEKSSVKLVQEFLDEILEYRKQGKIEHG